MAKLSDYPGVSSITDLAGTVRWRFRKAGKAIYLPGEPHTKLFDAAYQAAIEGRRFDPSSFKAEVVGLPGAVVPKSFDAAWRLVKRSGEWDILDNFSTKAGYQTEAEEFLDSLVADVPGSRWGAIEISEVRRKHIKAILGKHVRQPFKARRLMTVLKKMIVAAMDEDWIDHNPCTDIPVKASTNGHKAWPLEVREQFEGYWVPGTQARTAYALALWLGDRRSDVARVTWSQLGWKKVINADGVQERVQGFEFTQHKGRNRKGGGKTLFVPLTPMLAEALAPLRRGNGTILTKQTGEPYAERSLSESMKRWTTQAGLPRGYVLHGLRKTLGVMLAESGASTRQLMDILGHDAIAHAELYSREASQVRMSSQGMLRLVPKQGNGNR
jgi:integrase